MRKWVKDRHRSLGKLIQQAGNFLQPYNSKHCASSFVFHGILQIVGWMLGNLENWFSLFTPGTRRKSKKASENLLWMCKKATEAAEKAAIIKQKKQKQIQQQQ